MFDIQGACMTHVLKNKLTVRDLKKSKLKWRLAPIRRAVPRLDNIRVYLILMNVANLWYHIGDE